MEGLPEDLTLGNLQNEIVSGNGVVRKTSNEDGKDFSIWTLGYGNEGKSDQVNKKKKSIRTENSSNTLNYTNSI